MRFLKRIKRAFRVLTLESSTVFIAFIGMFVGFPAMLNPMEYAPTSIKETLPTWAVAGWGVSLLLGGLVTMVGILWQTRIALRIEQMGMTFLALGTFLYSMALIGYSDNLVRSSIALVPYAFFTWVCVARYWNLNRIAKAYSYADSLALRKYLDDEESAPIRLQRHEEKGGED